jgi:C1A family cysteine protease
MEKGDVKQLFKVWHYVFNRETQYVINSETGINKYKKFKENVALINKHNAKNLSWKEGLNQFSDMTETEAFALLGVRDKTKEEMNQMITEMTGKKFDFDSYVDEDEVRTSAPKERVAIDWEKILAPIRDQKTCGSCYTFSTQAAIEGNYNKNRMDEGKFTETVSLSTQQIVDCNATTGGCSGGWMGNAIKYLKAGISLEKNYPYTGVVGTCKYTADMASEVVVTGYETAGSYYTPLENDVYNLLLKGPLTNCVDTKGLLRYRSGVANLPCTPLVCPHAVNTVGMGRDDSTGLNFVRMRNSWGTSWGEAGYARIAQDFKNGYSCMLEFSGWTLRPTVN